MSRFLVFLCITGLALVPPGFCACRLAAAMPSVEFDGHDGSDEGDDHDDCECTRLKPDGMLSLGASAAPSVDADISYWIVPGPRVECSAGSHRRLFSSSPLHAGPPLYLTLRALLL